MKNYKASYNYRNQKVIKSKIVNKNSIEYFQYYKVKKIKIDKFKEFSKKLEKPKIICSINFGRVGSQILFETINKKVDLLSGYNLFNRREKKKFASYKNFESFFLKSLKEVEFNKMIFFEISPKRFLELLKFVDIKILKIFSYHLIFRRNILNQCLSYYISLNTGIWNNYQKKKKDNFFTNIDYKRIKAKLFEILKNIILFEKKISNFLKRNNISCLKQNYELIAKDKSHEAIRFINFYKLKKFLSKTSIKKNIIKKNVYDKKFYQILSEFKNDKHTKAILKKRIKI